MKDSVYFVLLRKLSFTPFNGKECLLKGGAWPYCGQPYGHETQARPLWCPLWGFTVAAGGKATVPLKSRAWEGRLGLWASGTPMVKACLLWKRGHPGRQGWTWHTKGGQFCILFLGPGLWPLPCPPKSMGFLPRHMRSKWPLWFLAFLVVFLSFVPGKVLGTEMKFNQYVLNVNSFQGGMQVNWDGQEMSKMCPVLLEPLMNWTSLQTRL